jgi:hypothetical protein
MRRWWRRRRSVAGNEDARKRFEQEAKLRAAQRETPYLELLAEQLADLPRDEVITRMRNGTIRRTA